MWEGTDRCGELVRPGPARVDDRRNCDGAVLGVLGHPGHCGRRTRDRVLHPGLRDGRVLADRPLDGGVPAGSVRARTREHGAHRNGARSRSRSESASGRGGVDGRKPMPTRQRRGDVHGHRPVAPISRSIHRGGPLTIRPRACRRRRTSTWSRSRPCTSSAKPDRRGSRRSDVVRSSDRRRRRNRVTFDR